MRSLLPETKDSLFRAFWALVSAICVGAFATLLILGGESIASQELTPEAEEEVAPISFSEEPFLDLSLHASSVMVFDIVHDVVVYEKDADIPQPLASLTKIMTAIIALEYGEPDMSVTLSLDAIAQEGDNNLFAHESWKLDDLVEYMLITSSNDAAYQIARTVPINGIADQKMFLDAMNQKAVALGLSSFSFESENGLDKDEMSSVFGSARDVVKLFMYAVEKYPDIFTSSSAQESYYLSQSGLSHIAENTNPVASKLPLLVASKTGYTKAAGGNLAFIFEIGPAHPIAVVILGSTFDGRFSDAEKLSLAAIQSFQAVDK